MAKHFMTALALVASAFVPGALATTSTQCSEVTAWAAIQNPSFESGTTGWDYEFDPSTTTTYNTNGSASLHLDTGLTSWIMSQTINNLLPRKTYTVSVDLLPYVNPQSGAAESCDLYLYHDVLSAQNFIVRKSVQTYTKNTNNWFTLSGTWTPAGSSGSLALYISCSPSNGGNVFNMYVDNFQATYTTSVCTTITSTPTPSSSAVQSSSAVIPSSSVVPSSSAVIPSSSVVPSSSAVIPSSSAVRISSSSAVPSSSAVIPSSSTSSSSSISSSATTSGSSLTTTTTATTSSTSLSANPTATATATALGSTTSTVFSTRTSTITACPTTITNCPARSTYVVTETIVVSTTVCPVTATAQPTGFSGGAGGASGAGGNLLSTSTLVSTRVVTITACPSTITNCPASQHTTYTTTEAIVTGTVVYTLTAGSSPGAGPTATIVPGTAVGAQPAHTSTSISVSPGQVSPGNGNSNSNGNGSGSTNTNTNPAAQPALPSTLKSSSSAIIPSTHAVSTTTTTAATHLYTGAAAPRLTLDTVLMAVPAALAVLAL